MNLYKLAAALFILYPLTITARAEGSTKYVELPETVHEQFDDKYGVPQFLETNIVTAGFSEIRVFAQIFVENYKEHPLETNAQVEVALYHTTERGSAHYSHSTFDYSCTSMIQGWFSEKIIGDTTRIVCFARSFPSGPYTVTFSYYLIP